ncbi:U6 snRNA-associated Sm-like protein LSm1 [Ramicandelaber brevisporus]|nr:U6 snRNA-associated Sm-like protein LSm1 [Ramicandelaber brevisporus]
MLRDGRKFTGILRSYDQFANLVLQDVIERVFVDDTFGDLDRGVLAVRGENVVMMGEIDLDKEDDMPLRQVDFRIAQKESRTRLERKTKETKAKDIMLRELGFSVDRVDTDSYS